MTWQPIPSEFPYIWGKFSYLLYQCTPPVSSTGDTQEDWERETTWLRKRRSPTIRRREGLALYKSFNTLCSTPLAIATFEPGHQVLTTVLRVFPADHEPLVVILLVQRGLQQKQCWGSGSAGSACFWASRIQYSDVRIRLWDPVPDPSLFS